MKLRTHVTPNAEERTRGRHWVLGIIVGLSVVVVINFYVAYLASSSHAELGREDYYLASLDYQTTLDARRRAARLGYSLRHDPLTGVQVEILGNPLATTLTGMLVLQRPNHAADDFARSVTFPLDTTSQSEIQSHLRAGRWQASFAVEGVEPPLLIDSSMYIEKAR